MKWLIANGTTHIFMHKDLNTCPYPLTLIRLIRLEFCEHIESDYNCLENIIGPTFFQGN